MQTQITGRVVAAAPFFDNGSFKKQTLIVEVVNGNFTSYVPVDFTQGDVDGILQQVQMNGTYQFTAWVQGSKQVMQDRNGGSTAYVSLKVSAVQQAQSQLPPTSAQTAPNAYQQQQPQQGGFGAPAQSQGGSQQPQQQGGFVGQPQQGSFGQPQQQQQNNFGQPPAQTPSFGNPPAQGNFGSGDANSPQGQGGGFNAPAQAPFGNQ